MAVSKTQQIKNTSSHDSRLSKYCKSNGNTGSTPPLLTLDLTQTVALVSPNGKGGDFFTGDEEMSDDTLTNVDLSGSNGVTGSKEGLNGSNNPSRVDLTSDGAVSNGVTGSKDGMNGSSNDTPEVDLTSDELVSNKGTSDPTQVVVSFFAV